MSEKRLKRGQHCTLIQTRRQFTNVCFPNTIILPLTYFQKNLWHYLTCIVLVRHKNRHKQTIYFSFHVFILYQYYPCFYTYLLVVGVVLLKLRNGKTEVIKTIRFIFGEFDLSFTILRGLFIGQGNIFLSVV